MKRFKTSLIALVVLALLLVWILTNQRGRVPEAEEVFRRDIASADDLTKIEVITFEEPAADEDEGDEDAADGEDADTDEDVDADGTDAAGPDSADKTDEDEDKADTRKRVEKTRVTIQKRGDEWYITHPYEGLIDPDSAESMSKAVIELKPDVREDADPASAEFGLDNPTMQVSFWLRSGNQTTVTLGEDTPVGAKIYAKISGKDGLFLMGTSFKSDMGKEPDTLRDKKLARFEKEEVVKASFTTKAGTVVAEKTTKNDEDVWSVTSPGDYKGDEWAITSAFGKVSEVEAKEFGKSPKDLKRYGLDKPRAQCKIELKDGKVFEVAVGKQITKKIKASEYADTEEEKDLVYAMRKGRPEVLLVENTLFDDLNKDLMALRDKHLLDIERDDVISLKVARKKGVSFLVARAGEEWSLRSPETGPANKSKVDDILWSLTDMEAREYVGKVADLKVIGLAVPSTTITIKLKSGDTLKVLFGDQVKDEADQVYYCQTSQSDQVYKVGDLALKDLPEKVEDLKPGAEGSSDPMGGLDGMPGSMGDFDPGDMNLDLDAGQPGGPL